MLKTHESPLDGREIKPVSHKRHQAWVFTGRTDAEAEVTMLWPPDLMSQLIGKDPDTGKDWGQEEKGRMRWEWDGWMASLTQWTWIWANREKVNDREAWHTVVHGATKSQTQLSNWTKTTEFELYFKFSFQAYLWQDKHLIKSDELEDGDNLNIQKLSLKIITHLFYCAYYIISLSTY